MYKQTFILSAARRNVIYSFAVGLFAILFWRFYDLQVRGYEAHLERSERNRVREVTIEPPRGLIFDRNSILLVDNRPSYAVSVISWEADKSPAVYGMLASYLDEKESVIRERIKKNSKGRFQPARVRRSIDFETLSLLEEHQQELPGVVYGLMPERFYPTNAKMSHLLGYLREISDEDLKRFASDGYEKGDLIGWIGIERYYELLLRGDKGYKYLQVDALGRQIGELPNAKIILPRQGNDIYLTINLPLQEKSEQLMENKLGAVVIIDPRNGEILSFVSSPPYELDTFAGPIPPEEWKALRFHDDDPLYNRATMSTYPPGSTYKLVAAAAAIDMGIIDLDWTVECKGYFQLGRRRFKCHKASGHGKVKLIEAIEQSCNVFFYTLSLKVGLDLWSEYGAKFGFGKKTGLDIPEENGGLLPDWEFMDRKYGEGEWQEGHILNLVLGQGDLLATPNQMAKFAMILHNAGKYYTPHFVKEIYYHTTDDTTRMSPVADSVRGIKPETFQILRDGMLRVVSGDKGTGRSAGVPGMKIYGKTGTAQNPHGDDHAWFIGFVEHETNPIALSVIVENGGMGSRAAAPIARELIKKYYSLTTVHLAEMDD